MADQSQDRIDSIIDLQATGAEVEALKKQVSELVSSIRGTSINIMDSKSHSEVSKMNKELDVLIATTDKKTDATIKAVKGQREFDKAILEGKLAKQQYNKELKTEIELQNAANGSVEQAKVAIKALTAQRDKLDLTTAEGIERQKVLNSLIDQNTDFIKENVDAAAKQRLNVGNYQGSAKIIVDSLKKVQDEIGKLQSKQQALQNFSKSNPIGFKVGGGESELAGINAQLGFAIQKSDSLSNIIDNPKFANMANLGDTNKELGFFTKRLNELEDAGLKNSDVYKDVQKRLAQLTDQIGDTRAEIKAMASDTRTFDQFSGAISLAADTFQTAAGAAVLFGASEEDAAEAIKTLTAIQSVANGVKGIANELTTKGTFANKIYAAVQAQVAIATNSSAAATARFSAILKLSGIGLLIIGLGVLASKLMGVAKGASEASRSVRELAGDLSYLDSQTQNSLKALENQNRIRVNGMKAAGASQKDLTEANIENIKSEKDLLTVSRDRNLELLNSSGVFGTRIKDMQTLSKEISFQKSVLEEQGDEMSDGVRKRTEQIIKSGQTVLDLNSKIIEKELQINDIRSDESGKAIEKQRQIAEARAAESDAKEKENREKNAAAQLGLDLLELKQSEDFYREVLEGEEKHFIDRFYAIIKYHEFRTAAINRQAKYELEQEGLTETQKILITKNAQYEILKISKEADKERELLQKSIKDGLTKGEEEFANKINEFVKSNFDNFVEAEKKKKEVQQKYLDERKGLILEEKNLYKSLYQEIGGLIEEFFTSDKERKIAALEDDKNSIDERVAREIDFINQTVTNKADAESRISIIEKQAQADKNVLENEQEQLEKKKQNIERLGKIAEIVGNTAQGVISLQIKAAEARATAGVLASNPLTAPFAAIALANAALIQGQIPFIVGIAAAQIIKLAIPKYATGGVHSKGGLLIAGDGGRSEALELPDGRVIKTPATDTMYDAPAGTKIHSDYDKFIAKVTVTKVPVFNPKSSSDTSTPLILYGLNGIKKAVERIPQPIIRVDNIISKKIRGNNSIV